MFFLASALNYPQIHNGTDLKEELEFLFAKGMLGACVFPVRALNCRLIHCSAAFNFTRLV